jgi:hypothetical protein
MVVSRRSVVLRVWGIVERAGLLGGCARESPTGLADRRLEGAPDNYHTGRPRQFLLG